MQTGERLGRYEVLHRLGKGGMGEVWKALDTSLQREVAIKTLPDALANDPDRLARLEREATLLAALNHPNIAAIHGLEESHGTRFLVLELVEGGTLADRLRRGPVSISEALKFGLQLAEALEAAHEKGILHRDLKPANICVTPEGRVKVLDFGLAKALERSDGAGLTAISTQAGAVMGTPAYMSPEQARGETLGRQTDIWSFGVVFYELLTGVSPFVRSSTADTLAQVLGTPPDYTLLPAGTPASVSRLVRRAVERDPKRRLQHMGDIRIEIEDALATLGSDPDSSALRPATLVTSRRGLMLAAGTIATVAMLGWVAWLGVRPPASGQVLGTVRLSLPFLEGPSGFPFGLSHLAISDDGSSVAFTSSGRLWIRRMDQKDALAVAGFGSNPFFSPDGKWVGMFTPREVMKVPVAGGAAIVIAPTTDRPAGATWHANGSIVFANTEGMYRASAEGGDARLLAAPNRQQKEVLYAWPRFMPDGQSLLFTIIREKDAPQIALLDVRTLETRIVLEDGSAAWYLPTGHLVYATGATLSVVGFDHATRRVVGDPVPVPDVEIAPALDNGAGDFAVSATGTLVFLPPQGSESQRTLRWIDRQANEEVLALEPRPYSYPRLSPDGRRVAFDVRTSGNRDIWILDLERLTQTRLTDGPTEDLMPVWSPDGYRVFFGSNRGGTVDVYSQAADGATGAKLEFASPGFQAPVSFSPDRTRLLVIEGFRDIKVLSFSTPNRLESLLRGDFEQGLAAVSPDGNWIAYESKESGGRYEIFVRSFPDVDRRREQVSVSGGRYPLWRAQGGNELYYVNFDGEMMAVSFTRDPDFKPGRATKLFDWEKPPANLSGMPYDISPIDGRFLMTKPIPRGPTGATQVSVVLNWLTGLRDRLPVR